MRFSDLIRAARGRHGLPFRAAHQLTSTIAQILAVATTRSRWVAFRLRSYGQVCRPYRQDHQSLFTYCLDIGNSWKRRRLHRRFQQVAPSVLDYFVVSGPDFLDRAEQYRTIGLGAANVGPRIYSLRGLTGSKDWRTSYRFVALAFAARPTPLRKLP